MATLNFVKTVTEAREIELTEGPDALTFGQMVDQEMQAAVVEGFSISQIGFTIDPEEWEAFRAANAPVSEPAHADRFFSGKRSKTTKVGY